MAFVVQPRIGLVSTVENGPNGVANRAYSYELVNDGQPVQSGFAPH
jgi:hypothetical protein